MSGNMVEPDLDDQFIPRALPLCASVGAPAARPAGCLAAESRTSLERFKPFYQFRSFLVSDRQGVPDMVELAVSVIKTEEE
jgi:hypothetical protein